MNQLRENIINYNQDLNDFDKEQNFENSNLKGVDEKQKMMIIEKSEPNEVT